MVQVSNAPQGRTYMLRTRVIDPNILVGNKPRHNPLYFSGADYIDAEIPAISVLNGMWVMEHTLVSGYMSKLIGVDPMEIEQICINDRHGNCTLLYICDKPFGLVVSEEINDYDWTFHPPKLKADGRKRLHYAHQIHKVELTNNQFIPELKLARQAPDLSRKMHQFPRGRDQKRNHLQWARLTDVVLASGLNAEQVLLGFWPYIGWSYDPTTTRHGTLLHIITSPNHAIIQNGHPWVEFLDQDEVRQLLTGSIQNIWIRAGLAKTILRLTALGIQPEVSQPV